MSKYTDEEILALSLETFYDTVEEFLPTNGQCSKLYALYHEKMEALGSDVYEHFSSKEHDDRVKTLAHSAPADTCKAVDKIDSPSHYAGDTEPIDLIASTDMLRGFCLGNAIKYIARAGKKEGESEVDDLKKARWYLDRWLQVVADKKDINELIDNLEKNKLVVEKFFKDMPPINSILQPDGTYKKLGYGVGGSNRDAYVSPIPTLCPHCRTFTLNSTKPGDLCKSCGEAQVKRANYKHPSKEMDEEKQSHKDVTYSCDSCKFEYFEGCIDDVGRPCPVCSRGTIIGS